MIVTVEIAFSFKHDLEDTYRRLTLPDGALLSDALHILSRRYPVFGERVFEAGGGLRKHINALVNGRNVQFRDGMETVLQDGDRLSILPPVGGG
jgi:molybdopterin synthase sulfur carrier subunit